MGGNTRQRRSVSKQLLYGLGHTSIADEAVHLVHLAILHGIAVMGGVTVVDIAVATALLLYETDLLRMMMMSHTRREQHRERCHPKDEDIESAEHGEKNVFVRI